MSTITTVKDKIPKKASWPGFLAYGKDSRTKVVLARKLEKQGLGSTPDMDPVQSILHEFILDWFVTLSAIAVAARGWRCWESRRRNITGTSRQDFRNGIILSDNALASRPGEQPWRRHPTCLSRPRTRCTSSHRWRCYVGCLWMVESLICVSKLYLSLFA